jgi:hypothetical protein
MFNARSAIRRLLAIGLLAGSTSALALDPITLVLLRMLRDQIVSKSLEAAVDTPDSIKSPSPFGTIPPPVTFDDAKLQSLIDEGFVHLTDAQRAEVYRSVKGMLADPKNAASRLMIIEELAVKASAVRQAHERLDTLSAADKRAVALQAREEYQKLAPAERLELAQVVRSRIVPIPGDLSDLILAEFGSVDAAASAVAVVQ